VHTDVNPYLSSSRFWKLNMGTCFAVCEASDKTLTVVEFSETCCGRDGARRDETSSNGRGERQRRADRA